MCDVIMKPDEVIELALTRTGHLFNNKYSVFPSKHIYILRLAVTQTHHLDKFH